MLKEAGNSLIAYADLFLVHCPNCNSCSKVFTPPYAKGRDEPRYIGHESKRFLCTKCGYMKDIHPKRRWDNLWAFDFELFDEKQAVDWYFGFPLFLQSPCCGHKLWFFNLEHLAHIETYIQQIIRPANLYYLSPESRLPKWMKLAKNRKEVLRAMEQLKYKVLDC